MSTSSAFSQSRETGDKRRIFETNGYGSLEMAVGCRDLSQIGSILRQDKTVNSLFKSVTRELITFMMEDPRTITRSIDMMFAAKAIERIADHATNIAGSVVYMVKGLNIRHVRLKTAASNVEAARAEDAPSASA